jgi:hypothetical protein
MISPADSRTTDFDNHAGRRVATPPVRWVFTDGRSVIMAKKIDWKAEAAETLKYTTAYPMQEAHRGAMAWREPGVVVMFENRGERLSEEQADAAVGHIREILKKMGAEVLGFASEDGSWALLVRSDEVDRLDALAWQGWAYGCGETTEDGRFKVCEMQSAIARRVIADHGYIKGTPTEPDGRLLEKLIDVCRQGGMPITPEVVANLRNTARTLTAMGAGPPRKS